MLKVLVNPDTGQIRVLILPHAFRVGDAANVLKFEETVETLLKEGWTMAYENSYSRPIEEVRVFS